MKMYEEFDFHLKEYLQENRNPLNVNIKCLFSAAYAILLSNYADENKIFIACFTNIKSNLKPSILEIDIDIENTASNLLTRILNNSFITPKITSDKLDAIIIFSTQAATKNDILFFLNQYYPHLECNIILLVNTNTYSQKIIYKTHVYLEETIIALEGHLKKIIFAVLQKPNLPLKELVILTSSEWNKIILEWNKTDAYFPKDKSIPELFKENINKYGNSVALNFKNKNMTYNELDILSSNLARYLTNFAVHAERDIVGIYMERGFQSFISLLGILKAGSAYLPIHLHFPPERIQIILEDANVSILITQKKLIPKLSNIMNMGINIIPIEAILEKQYSGIECSYKIECQDLAYIIYTSGTTGKPKGTKISHKGVLNLITHVKKDYGVTYKTKVLQFASLSFDASVYEWAGTLLNGGELYILSEDELPPKTDLTHYLREKEINFALLPPPVLNLVDNFNLKKLHTLVSGGEACTQHIVDKWANGRKLFNAYGPSEATVACSFARCYPQKKITIGKPIQNVKLYILNKYKQPVPIGIPGELYIESVGLAQGYLNRDDLTEQAFISNPFSLNKADRIYKTGDRVRWLKNGEIEYINRIDSQIKLQGYRIELGEIEATLNQFPDIESSSVIVHNIDNFHKQLIAFYILKREIKEIDKEPLNNFMNKKLPKYMIPAHYLKISSFPLTLTNKIDRNALIKIYEACKNEIITTNNQNEIILILEQIWQELLNTDNVNGNFFSLGGDSIRAIQFVALLQRHGYLIPSKVLYDNPTIAELANILKKETNSRITSHDQYAIAQGEIGLSPIQYWFFEHNFKDYNQWNQAFLLKTNNLINKQVFCQAWKLIIKHHDTLRLRYKLNSKKIKQYFDENEDSYTFIFKEFDFSKRVNSNSAWLTNKCIELQNSLNIETGPILAVGIFNNHEDGQQRVLIAIHHLLIDGISWRILLEDFFNIFDQLSQFKKVTLLPKSSHYGIWIKALHKYARRETTKSQIPYWQNISKKITQSKSTRVNLIKDQHHHILTLSKEITLGLLLDLPSHYPLHINDILLSALAYALYEETKEYEYVIDLEGHGREDCIKEVNVTRTLGWFTTIFPTILRIPPYFQKSNDSSWSDLILGIKSDLCQIPDKGIGYGVLKYFNEKHSNSEKQFFNANPPILFNYLGQFDLPSKYQAIWSFASESPGNFLGTDYFGKENYSRYALEINAVNFQESLCINFNYNKYLYSEEQIKRLANNYKIALEQFVILGRKLALGNLYLPSEYPLTETIDNKVEKIIGHEPYKPFSLVKVIDYKDFIPDINLIEDIYPASYLQKRMLLEAARDKNKGTYHIVSNYTIHTKLDKKKLFSILEQLIKRHELLRAGFIYTNNSEYSVVIYKDIEINYQFYQNQNSKELIEEEKLKNFDYSKPGLFRVLINDKGNHFDLIFSFHNAIEDGWSMATLINEFGSAYINNMPIQPNLKLRYGEFIRNEIRAIRNKKNVEFWKEYLDNLNIKKINWKSDNEKSENSLYACFFNLNFDQVSLIHKISKELGITVDSIFLLTYLKTLSHFIGINDITVGIATNNRIEKEDGDKLFGLFINIIPFRFNLIKNSGTLGQLLEIFKDKLKLHKFKNLPYEYIKSLYNHDLYEFVFDFVHLHILTERVKGVESTDGYERTHIPFTLTVAQRGNDAFILSISAHDDFVNKGFLNGFTQYFKDCLTETLSFICVEMDKKNIF